MDFSSGRVSVHAITIESAGLCGKSTSAEIGWRPGRFAKAA
jgi:hypothetical protein